MPILELLIKSYKILFWSITTKPLGLLKFQSDFLSCSENLLWYAYHDFFRVWLVLLEIVVVKGKLYRGGGGVGVYSVGLCLFFWSGRGEPPNPQYRPRPRSRTSDHVLSLSQTCPPTWLLIQLLPRSGWLNEYSLLYDFCEDWIK